MNVYVCSIWIDVVELSFYLISRAALEIESSVCDYSRVCCFRKLDKIKMQTFSFQRLTAPPYLLQYIELGLSCVGLWLQAYKFRNVFLLGSCYVIEHYAVCT
jgi:hypothetical protein